MLGIGTKAPDFSLPDQNGTIRSLSDFKGQRIVLYFYSKDMTSGCTRQACGFAELYPQLTEKGAVVIGVSRDTVASHKKFEEKYALPFILLSDPDLAVIQAYDVWKEKMNYGKIYCDKQKKLHGNNRNNMIKETESILMLRKRNEITILKR